MSTLAELRFQAREDASCGEFCALPVTKLSLALCAGVKLLLLGDDEGQAMPFQA